MAANIHCEDDKFGEDYLVLKPNEATWFDLGRLLISSDLKNEGFIEFPEERLIRNCERRWVIFMSVFAQKLLLTMKKPMAFCGDVLEWWLNIFSDNGGKMVKPEKTSATYRSTIGNLDTRIELEKWKEDDLNEDKHKGLLSFMASKLSYENEAFVKSVVEDHWEVSK
ncbi:hypothetical protein ACFE04_005482 [Oxalis oulophora]